MPGSITIVITSDEITPTMQELQNKFSDLSELLLAVGAVWSQQMAMNFATAPWPPLAIETVARKMVEGYPMDMLVRSGDMKGAATEGEWSASGNEAHLMVPGYSQFHFDGTSFMPARDYSFLSASFDGMVQDAFGAFLGL